MSISTILALPKMGLFPGINVRVFVEFIGSGTLGLKQSRACSQKDPPPLQ